MHRPDWRVARDVTRLSERVCEGERDVRERETAREPEGERESDRESARESEREIEKARERAQPECAHSQINLFVRFN